MENSLFNQTRAFVRPGVQCMRGLSAYAGTLPISVGKGPLSLFMPAYGRTGAGLLRIYNIARALRKLGWRTAILPPNLTLKQRRWFLQNMVPDVVVMQGARHELNRPALYPEWPIVFDMDDADFHLPHLEAFVAEAMGQVRGVMAGSTYVADWCRDRGVEAHVVWTGTPVSQHRRTPHSRRPLVVAWAQTRPETYDQEAKFVLQVMGRLSRQMPQVRLRLYDRRNGDGAFLDRFQSAGIQTDWVPSCGYKAYLASFDDVALGLAPLCPQTPFSRGKSFGKVLAYLDAHVPVIASDACEHGRFFDAKTGVVSSDPDRWVDEMARLLRAPMARQAMGKAAFEQFGKRLSLEAAAAQVSRVLWRYI